MQKLVNKRNNIVKIKLLNPHKQEEGFTLIELMIVIVILGILAAIAIPIFINQQKAANYSVLQQDVKNVATAAVSYKATSGHYPRTCDEWREVFPEGYKSGTTSAIGATVSPDGFNLWVEAQAQGMGSNSGSGMTLEEVDSYTPVLDTKAGEGVMSRSQYMDKHNLTNRERVFYDAGYTNSGFMVSGLGHSCNIWGSVTP